LREGRASGFTILFNQAISTGHFTFARPMLCFAQSFAGFVSLGDRHVQVAASVLVADVSGDDGLGPGGGVRSAKPQLLLLATYVAGRTGDL
jgi:hypothetical protein